MAQGVQRYCQGVLLGSLLFVSLSALSAMLDKTSDNWNVDGSHGMLHVSGVLTEGACRLDMQSAYQQISLGTVPAGQLHYPGNQGAPVAVQLSLRDCLHSGGHQDDLRSGNRTSDRLQPVVSVTFKGAADADNPDLLQVQGTSGLALRLQDSNRRDVRLGDRGTPQYLMPNNSQLTYYIMPERTSAPLVTGAWRSVVNFGLNYD
ncbi:Fimbrial protein [Edwardsiella anguillarum]|uniref:Fimbrial protein domain-containing protein n=2 Tax=Edwardsiella anguillarum TaxID=1821960 RepID=A0A076LF02_9GAMM|nr:fimbrial protein [Edwardsiella anguillarum]GAJ66135.1 fimbrial protein [Edwardsiella piscicida]AIJ06756.1 fimbrial protein domain-containing protein [Edwardsiella anguillarum ET080813]KAB0593592.1 type 1 fimbrial protein [Edwardsiella anguillarum]UOU77932.1 type 1 fimbrial protein [Edwardsiella anguillarum]WHP97901.1 type 1 fimbrial protein [Edwardsiella anguillarum]